VEEKVDKVFVTGALLGFSRIMNILFLISIPFTRFYLELFRFKWFTQMFEKVVGIRWSEELIQDMKRWNSLSRLFRMMTKDTPNVSDVVDNVTEKVDVQLCLCTGSKEPLAKKIMQVDGVMREKVKVCRSFVALGVVHMWDAQAPKLFAETVDLVFSGEELPPEIVPMEEYYNVATGKKRRR
jgi:hypothetical protein